MFTGVKNSDNCQYLESVENRRDIDVSVDEAFAPVYAGIPALPDSVESVNDTDGMLLEFGDRRVAAVPRSLRFGRFSPPTSAARSRRIAQRLLPDSGRNRHPAGVTARGGISGARGSIPAGTYRPIDVCAPVAVARFATGVFGTQERAGDVC